MMMDLLLKEVIIGKSKKVMKLKKKCIKHVLVKVNSLPNAHLAVSHILPVEGFHGISTVLEAPDGFKDFIAPESKLKQIENVPN